MSTPCCLQDSVSGRVMPPPVDSTVWSVRGTLWPPKCCTKSLYLTPWRSVNSYAGRLPSTTILSSGTWESPRPDLIMSANICLGESLIPAFF